MVTIHQRVRDIIARQLKVEPTKVVMDARLRDDLNADALDFLELTMAFEDEFGVNISDKEAQEIIVTVGDAVRYLEVNCTK